MSFDKTLARRAREAVAALPRFAALLLGYGAVAAALAWAREGGTPWLDTGLAGVGCMAILSWHSALVERARREGYEPGATARSDGTD